MSVNKSKLKDVLSMHSHIEEYDLEISEAEEHIATLKASRKDCLDIINNLIKDDPQLQVVLNYINGEKK